MPELAQQCIASWRQHMPGWKYKLWNEDNFDVNSVAYTKEAYKAKKYAFVSDYVRLWALYNEGGLYLDVDFEVYQPFDNLMYLDAFAGFEGSKYSPLMMGVVASRPKGIWVSEQLRHYQGRHFVNENGSFDMTTNVQYISKMMRERGFVQNGKEQDYQDLHIFPVEYFCPRQTTGEYFCTTNTYCEHLGLNSWADKGTGWKKVIGKIVGRQKMIWLIKLKRKLFG